MIISYLSNESEESQFIIVAFLLFFLSTFFILLTVNFFGAEIDLVAVSIIYTVLAVILFLFSFLKTQTT